MVEEFLESNGQSAVPPDQESRHQVDASFDVVDLSEEKGVQTEPLSLAGNGIVLLLYTKNCCSKVDGTSFQIFAEFFVSGLLSQPLSLPPPVARMKFPVYGNLGWFTSLLLVFDLIPWMMWSGSLWATSIGLCCEFAMLILRASTKVNIRKEAGAGFQTALASFNDRIPMYICTVNHQGLAPTAMKDCHPSCLR